MKFQRQIKHKCFICFLLPLQLIGRPLNKNIADSIHDLADLMPEFTEAQLHVSAIYYAIQLVFSEKYEIISCLVF